MSSQILSYNKTLTSFGSPGTTENVVLSMPIKIGSNAKVRLIDFHIDAQICNIFNYGGINNGLVAVSNDDWTTTTVIQLDNGVYSSVSNIQNAINKTIAGWYIDYNDPGIVIQSNPVLGKNYMTIDSTKLAVAGQLAINFAYNGSLLGELLGFTAPATFNTDGLKEADAFAQVDFIGNEISVKFIGLGNLSMVNNEPSTEIARVNLSDSTVQNVYSYPSIMQPMISIIENKYGLQTYQVVIEGTRYDASGNARPIYILNGSCFLRLEIINS